MESIRLLARDTNELFLHLTLFLNIKIYIYMSVTDDSRTSMLLKEELNVFTYLMKDTYSHCGALAASHESKTK